MSRGSSFSIASLQFVIAISLALTIASCYGQSAGISGLPEDPVVPRGEFAHRVHAYNPAPGQSVHRYGNPNYALGAPDGKFVTLGGFGGSLTLLLPHAIRNRPGTDFVVWGNAFYRGENPRQRWAEPALIEISSNGVDWLVIAGSLFEGRPAASLRTNIVYQKTNENFWPPSVTESTQLVRGTCDLTASFCKNISTNQNWAWTNATHSPDGLWGHADVTPFNFPLAEYWTPDEPLTLGAQGAGGDAIDLDWARREDGSTPAPSELTNIRYIRLTTAVKLMAGIFGEFSTEIDAIGVCW